MKNFLEAYRNLPLTQISDRKILKRLKGKSRFLHILVDIFGDSPWNSKVSFWGNIFIMLAILLSCFEVILISEKKQDIFTSDLLKLVYWATSIVFSIELLLRLYVAKFYDAKYKGLKGKIRYLLTFYGFIDFLSVFPFYADLLGFSQYHFLKILRVIRIWRIVRYVRTIANLGKAFRMKGEEILVSLLGVLLLSLTISKFIYYAEE
ncbi:MAG: ion transporter, partial [Raineya sp.]|nr:ion transporter [Raineya sp.]